MKRTDLLDPRVAPEPTILDSVCIPFSDLPERSHELPAKGHILRIADVPGSVEALSWLISSGRETFLVDDFIFGQAGQCRLWSPTKLLEREISEIHSGRALDLGCGTGRDAVFLASLGWSVVAADILPDALERGRDLAVRYAPDGDITWVVEDLEKSLPEGLFDLITMFRSYDLEVLRQAAERVVDGGLLLVESFSKEHQLETGHPSSPRRAIESEQAMKALEKFGSVRFEHQGPMARIWARK